MKRRRVKPIGARARTHPIRSEQPEQLSDLVEDPIAEKRDMTAEQQAALKKPEESDPRVKASESDQGRTR
jgi:hypothetical protein